MLVRQSCASLNSTLLYASFARNVDLEQELAENEEITNYCSQMRLHLSDAMQLSKRGFPQSQYRIEAEKIKMQILGLSDCQAEHPAIRRWQDSFVEKSQKLYQPNESSQNPAENNYAEREIIKVVIARKMSFGSQSTEGQKPEKSGRAFCKP